MAFVNILFFSDFLHFDIKSLLLLTVTLQGVSNKHCLLSCFFIAYEFELELTVSKSFHGFNLQQMNCIICFVFFPFRLLMCS